MADIFKRIAAIDPGANGALVVVTVSQYMHTSLRVNFDCYQDFLDADPLQHVIFDSSYIEKVASSPRMGTSSAFNFGQSFGRAKQYLLMKTQPEKFNLVMPHAWQTALNCLARGDKNILKQKAQKLFPDHKITLKNADAFLIAAYALRKEGYQW